jgi:hypothetical protein
MTIIAIGWTSGNKNALATIIQTSNWEKLRNMKKLDGYDVQTDHKHCIETQRHFI